MAKPVNPKPNRFNLLNVSIGEILARCFNGLIFIGQTCLLYYFMYTGFPGDWRWLGWVAADAVFLGIYIVLNVLAIRYFGTVRRKPVPQLGLLPYAFITWIFYSVILAGKVFHMFKTFARDLPDGGWMGTNLMKIAIGLSAAFFALLVAGHHRNRSSERHKFCLKWLQTHVVFELLDTVEFLSILFANETKILLSWSVEHAILAYSVMNLIIPAVALYQLSGFNFSKSKPLDNLILIQSVIATAFVNIPYVVIRLYLWHSADVTTALFIMKNFIAIVNTFWELRKLIPCCSFLDFTDDSDSTVASIEMVSVGGKVSKERTDNVPFRSTVHPVPKTEESLYA
ncbi:uncharacterized protein LOC129584503 [Paramacrobiotus metropolitanus]|uniref:uncharacterized protein LOC129584503 n=1 Tax=Paramacrobiotus metropolitanus TaxID=2943436 RepID=UPI002445BA9B|nr:uncharacterized protein LOC129584503 [Paramacrobiotus metropolitanus]